MDDDKTNNNEPHLKSVGSERKPSFEEKSNVIDMQTRQSLLPSQLRRAIIGQYAESTAFQHTPVEFAHSLEKRLLAESTYAIAELVKDLFKGDKNE